MSSRVKRAHCAPPPPLEYCVLKWILPGHFKEHKYCKVSDIVARCLVSIFLDIFISMVGGNFWIDPKKYLSKCPKCHVRQWAIYSFVAIVT